VSLVPAAGTLALSDEGAEFWGIPWIEVSMGPGSGFGLSNRGLGYLA